MQRTHACPGLSPCHIQHYKAQWRKVLLVTYNNALKRDKTLQCHNTKLAPFGHSKFWWQLFSVSKLTESGWSNTLNHCITHCAVVYKLMGYKVTLLHHILADTSSGANILADTSSDTNNFRDQNLWNNPQHGAQEATVYFLKSMIPCTVQCTRMWKIWYQHQTHLWEYRE